MTKRNYGIDFLRILSMFMVVILHVLGKGGLLDNTQPHTVNYYTSWFLEVSAYCAVNVFALISGHVMCYSKPRLSRIAELWLQVFFYSLLTTVLFLILMPETFSFSAILNALFPVTRKHYWYISAYFGMYLFIPLLNYVIQHLNKKTFLIVLSSCFLAISVLPTLLHTDTYNTNEGYSTIWLCLMYIVGGYIKRFDIVAKAKKSVCLLVFSGSVILTWASKIFLEIALLKVFGKETHVNILIKYTSPTMVLAAIGLFIFCCKIDFPKVINKFISFLSPAALGVYLIHVSAPVWNNVISGFSAGYSKLSPVIMLLLIVASSVVIYCTCTAIELLRIQLFKLLRIKNLCMKIDSRLTNKINKLFDKHIT